jgi:hypothetical protein
MWSKTTVVRIRRTSVDEFLNALQVQHLLSEFFENVSMIVLFILQQTCESLGIVGEV